MNSRTLSVIDPERIAYMTRNEADMAFRRRAKLIFEYIEPGDGKRILDLPCGRGFYLNMLRYVCDCQLVGADLDREVIKIAKRNLANLNDTHIQRASIYRMPYPNNYFDAVILSEILEHIKDDVAGLREAWRVLKPGGVLAVTVPNANYPFLWDPINKILEALINKPIRSGPLAGIWANHVRLYTPVQLRRAVKAAGFEIVDERCMTHSCFPFIHNLVYGFGKPLLEFGGLPGSWDSVAGRANLQASGGRSDPVRLCLALLMLFDRPNQDREPEGCFALNLAIKGLNLYA